MKIYNYILLSVLFGATALITSCQRDEEVIVSTITTNKPTYVHADNATISIELDYNSVPKQYGICYGTDPKPTIKNSLALCADSVGQLCELLGLEAATTYYARAFVQNKSDVLYGNEISFTTAERLTESGHEYVDMGLSVKWATMNVGATIAEEGGDYFAWGEVERKESYMWDNYQYGNSRTTLTKYCESEEYGTVDNKAILDLWDDAAYMIWGGKWRMPTYNEWDELLRNSTWTWVEQNGVKGVRVRSTKNGNCIFLPTTGYKVGTDLNYKDDIVGFWTSSLSKNGSYMSYGVSVESPNNTASFYGFNRYNGYPIRAVMDNAITPPAVDIPVVVTSAASEVTKNSAVVGGNVLSDGGLEVTERGVVYSTSQNPTIEDSKVSSGSGLGEFTCNLINLQTGATYYARAYAKNKFYVVYGEEISFVCMAPPIVTTLSPTNISYTSAIVSGNVTDDGGASVTERGICYSTSVNPTISDITKTSSRGTGYFTCILTDLQNETTYYARAYAVNSKGIAYGEEVSFTTKVKTIATVTTSQATNISYTSATVGGNVTDNGGLEVTERGMVYGTSQNPTTEDGKVASGSGLGEFTCDLTALQDGVTYYARAYAINEKGTAYGEEVSFTTKIDDPLTFTVNGVSFTMIAVQGGTFTMGATSEQGSDAFSDETPTHKVTVSYYMIGETEVTQELWKAVMGTNPSYFDGTGTQNPVEQVSWEDCQNFIAELNAMTGKKFRLPTEAEWEYAARGGNKSNGFRYAGSNTLGDVAWYDGNTSRTHSVKQKQANELGIYDMSGNVYEWCQDWYGSYSSSAQTNPTGPSSGSDRVNRGGSGGNYASVCRVSHRGSSTPTLSNRYLGLRLAL